MSDEQCWGFPGKGSDPASAQARVERVASALPVEDEMCSKEMYPCSVGLAGRWWWFHLAPAGAGSGCAFAEVLLILRSSSGAPVCEARHLRSQRSGSPTSKLTASKLSAPLQDAMLFLFGLGQFSG